MAFGKEIKRLREEVPISAQKLADLIGIDVERMRKWEQKDLDPRHEDVMKIEDFFGLEMKEIQALKSIKKFVNVPHGTIGNKAKGRIKFEATDKELLTELIRDNRRTKATVNVLRIAIANLIAISENESTTAPDKEKVEIILGRLDRSIDVELDKLYEIDKKKFS